jgi:hypothetical protein
MSFENEQIKCYYCKNKIYSFNNIYMAYDNTFCNIYHRNYYLNNRTNKNNINEKKIKNGSSFFSFDYFYH